MKTLQIYEPAMCCSTGVCGPSVDDNLLRFSSDLQWLKENGVEVKRFNLSSHPQEFVGNLLVTNHLEKAPDELPLFIVDGAIKHTGGYPDRQTLATWFNLVVIPALPRLKLF